MHLQSDTAAFSDSGIVLVPDSLAWRVMTQDLARQIESMPSTPVRDVVSKARYVRFKTKDCALRLLNISNLEIVTNSLVVPEHSLFQRRVSAP